MHTYQNTKPTNIAWLGEIPSHWEVYPLWTQAKPKSIINKIYEPLLSVYLDKGVIPFDEVQEKRTNVTSLDLSKYQFVEIGDFVLNNQQAWRGSVGVSKYQGIVSPAYLVLSLSDNLNRNFANYLFRNGAMVAHYLISSRGVGTIQRNLYWGQLKNTPLFLPPLSEQTAIANFLDKKTAQIKEAIALKSEQIDKLKEYRQTLINQTVTQGLNPSVAIKNSGVEWLGEMPGHWEVKKLKYILQLSNEKTESQKSNLRYIGMENIISNTGELTDTILEAEGIANVFYQNEILFGKLRPYLAKVYLAEINGICSTEFLVYKTTKQIFNKFAFYLMICQSFIEMVNSSTYGTKMPRANSDFLANSSIPLPPLSEQIAIADFLDKKTAKIDTAIRQYQAEIDKLKEYQQSLINEVVTGKVSI